MSARTVWDEPIYLETEGDPARRSHRTYGQLIMVDQDELLSENLGRLGRAVGRSPEVNLEAEKAFRLKSREQLLYVYLGELKDSEEINDYTGILAGRVWRDFRNAADYKVRVPRVSSGGDGEVFFTWDHDEHHLEIEIFPDGRVEFFYLNRRTDESWPYEQLADTPIPSDVIDKAAVVTRA